MTALRSATVSLASPTEVVPTENLIGLAQACDSHQRVTFSYVAQDGRTSERRAEPHRLVATDRRWYLVAYDLDRIARDTVGGRPFADRFRRHLDDLFRGAGF